MGIKIKQPSNITIRQLITLLIVNLSMVSIYEFFLLLCSSSCIVGNVLPTQCPGGRCDGPPPPPPQYPTPSPVQDYKPDIGQTNVGGYGVNKEPYCHMVEKVVFENQCEPYTERTCYTQNKESCFTKPFRNCSGVIETNVERVCFDVNELVCDLVEAIHYETLEETYQVQRCFTGKDRVCDTTYKIDMTTKDDYQCTNVETPNCYMEEEDN